jgi:oleandomycin transport system permease protein
MTTTEIAAPQLESTVDNKAEKRSTAIPPIVRHSLTLAWRTIIRIRYNPEQLIDVTLQPIIFILLFVFVFGGAISSNWHDYLPFVLPGIMAQTVVFATMSTGVNLSTDITKGVFDRFRSLPISRSAPLIGAVLGDVVRYIVTMVVILGFGMALGFRIHTDPISAIAACLLVLLFALAFCWITVWIGLMARSPGSVQGIAFVFMFPLTFGSNVFAQTSSMPGWLQAWVKVNPVTQLVDSVRGLLLGGPVAGPVWHTLAWAAGFVVVFASLAIRAYRRRA